MSGAALLARIRDAGIDLQLRDGKLAGRAAPGVLTPERRAWLERHRAELTELLAAEPASRGPCVHCGAPVAWLNGLRNWYGDLVHLRCPVPARLTPDEPEPSAGA